MMFQEKFNEVCTFPDYFESFDEIQKAIETRIRSFNEEYEIFKRDHGIENMYFSRIEHIETVDNYITKVYYSATDLYLTYLEANNLLPQGAIVETFLIEENYLYNTPQEWKFKDSMRLALEQKDKIIRKNKVDVYSPSMFEGVTERIKLSAHSNGLPGMIVERIPMTYDDLIDKNS